MRTIKYLLILTIISGFFVCFISNSFAGNADIYKITVQTIQLKNSSDEWVTIATPNEEVDIAAVGAGAVAGSFLNDVAIPAGSYKNFKLVLSETMKVSGSDTSGATTYYTKSGGTLTITGDDSDAASTETWPDDVNVSLNEGTESATTTSSEQGEVTFTLDLDASDGDDYIEVTAVSDSSTPVVVKADSTISIWWDFDTQDTVHYTNDGGNHKMYYTPPGEGTAFAITVDGATTTVTESDMKIDF